MINHDLERKIAHLESVNDQMYAELCYVDQLMKMIGFSDGLATVKLTAEELKNTDIEDESKE